MLYPRNQILPQGLTTEQFLCVPLKGSHLKTGLRNCYGEPSLLKPMETKLWPTPDFTLEENLVDLQMYEAEHLKGVAYTFTLLNAASDECLGCVYITSFSENLKSVCPEKSEALYPAMIRFWVRACHLGSELERHISRTLIEWFKTDWLFDASVFVTSVHCVQQHITVLKLGLTRREVS